jgi:hypothetical protein
MAIDEKEFNDNRLETRTNTGAIAHIVERMGSFHHDNKQRFDKIDSKFDEFKNLLAQMPTEDKIYRMFSEESKQTALGIMRHIERVDNKAIEALDSANTANSELNFAKRQGYIFAGTITSIGGIIAWFKGIFS